MPLLTIPSVAKGTAATIQLDKSALFALPGVSGDAYFSDQANVASCIIEYNSDPGNQRRILSFDLSQATPSASFLASARARDDFQIERLILVDYDGGSLVLPRAALPTGLDIGFAPVLPSLGISAEPAVWFNADLISGNQGDSVTTWTDGKAGLTAVQSVPAGFNAAGYQAPTLNKSVRNGRNSLAFDGNQHLFSSAFEMNKPSTLALVFRMDQVNGGGGSTFLRFQSYGSTAMFFTGGSAYAYYVGHVNNQMAIGSGGTLGKWGIMIGRNTLTDHNFSGFTQDAGSVTNTNNVFATGAPFPVTGLQIGKNRNNAEGLIGQIGEIILYNEHLSDADTATLMASLRTRWAI